MKESEIAKILKTDINKNILRFFYNNPSCIDSAKGISTWIDADEVKTSKALEKLVKQGLLLRHTSSSFTGYGWDHDINLSPKLKKVLVSSKTK